MSLNPLHPNISVQILYTVHDRSWYISYITYKENLFNNQELLIFMTLMFDSGVILFEEIRCLSLLGVKGKMVDATEWKRYQLLLIKTTHPHSGLYFSLPATHLLKKLIRGTWH